MHFFKWRCGLPWSWVHSWLILTVATKTGERARGREVLPRHTKALSWTSNHHTHTKHRKPTEGKHVPIVRGSHEPPCSFSPDNSCIDNTYQLERYKRRGRRHRKGTKRHKRKKASQPVNGYTFTSLQCRTFFPMRKIKVLCGSNCISYH